jgi:hypothetical protein
MKKVYTVINNSIYWHTQGSHTVYHYVCENNEIDKWQAWCEEVGAEKGTVEDMLDI